MPRSLNPVPQYFDSQGNVLGGGQMYYYESGTTTFKTTYADVNETIPNTNPVILDGAGRLPNVFFSGVVRQVLEDKDGLQIWDKDPVEFGDNGGAFSAYDSNTTYSENDLVLADDGNYYRSLTNGNQNNEPSVSPTAWAQVEFLEYWNENIDYAVGDNVKTSDGRIWRSLQTPNLNNDPALSLEWGGIQLDAYAFVESYIVTFGYGIEAVQNVGGDANVIFDKSVATANDQAIFVANLETRNNTYADPTNYAVDRVLVQTETASSGASVATDKFVIYRVTS